MKSILLIIGLSLLVNLGFSQTSTSLPSVKIKDINGKEIDLKDTVAAGRITIISFWATWCTPCKKELDNINELLEEWSDKYKVDLIAISIDNATNAVKVKPFVNGKGWEFTVLLDVNSDCSRIFNFPPNSVPFTMLIDQNKNIVYTHNSYSEGDEFVLEEEIKKLTK